jgi:hypothetical protein
MRHVSSGRLTFTTSNRDLAARVGRFCSGSILNTRHGYYRAEVGGKQFR